ncbi:MAG: ornithine cyclodeaminase family protein [Acidobacteriota bacterium]|jgi:ornithine cyclodeaminase
MCITARDDTRGLISLLSMDEFGAAGKGWAMAVILNLTQIKEILNTIDPHRLIGEIAEGFTAYSQGKVVVPPVGELVFDNPRGDMHIKYGYIKLDDYYVIKIACGFYDNPKIGLPTSSGLMLLFSQKTGALICILLDDGLLTHVRTAAAGAVVAQYFAPKQIRGVGIFGAGVQGRMQLQYLRHVRDVRAATVWGVDHQELDAYKKDMEVNGFTIRTTLDAEEIASTCNLIVTATPSCKPLLNVCQIRRGTHITAMGSDTREKQELDPAILKIADRIVVDSLSQCRLRGEAFHALEAGMIQADRLIELGAAIADGRLQRQSDDEITVVDLTGVAVQDIQISKAVWRLASKKI